MLFGNRVACLAVLLSSAAAFAQTTPIAVDLTATPRPLTAFVKPGETLNVILPSLDASATYTAGKPDSDLTLTVAGNIVSIKVNKVSAKPLFLSQSDAKEINVVKVAPPAPLLTLYTDTATLQTAAPGLVESEPHVLYLGATGSCPATPGDGAKVVSEDKSILDVDSGNFVPKKLGHTTVRLVDGPTGRTLETYNITVADVVKSLLPGNASQQMYSSDTKALPDLGFTMERAAGGSFDASLLDVATTPPFAWTEGTLRTGAISLSQQATYVMKVTPKTGKDDICKHAMPIPELGKDLTIALYDNPGQIIVSSTSRNFVASSNSTQTLTAVLSRSSATEVVDAGFNFEVAPGGGTSAEVELWKGKLKFQRISGNSTLLVADFRPEDLAAEPALRKRIPVLVSLVSSAAKVPSAITVYIQLSAVSGFGALKVNLNLVDNRTAEDLFGARAVKEYYVAKLRLFNDLKNDLTGLYTGASVLAYSESLEVGVTLEKKCEDHDCESRDKARALTPPECPALSHPTPNAVAGAKGGGVGTVTNGRDASADNGRQYVALTDADFCHLNSAFGPDPELDKTSGNAVAPTPTRWLSYRPFTAEVMINTVDARDSRTFRSRAFRLLNGVSLIASTVTAIAVPGSGSDLPTGIDKYSNLFLPGLAKLFPSMKETERQNVVNLAMRQIEEIPFGSEISRYIFLPKREFQGFLDHHKVKIAEVSGYHFKVNVAILSSDAKSTVDTAVPTAR